MLTDQNSQSPSRSGSKAPEQKQNKDETIESLKNVTRDIQDALDAQNFADAITQSTEWKDTYRKCITKVIELRAIAFEKSSNNSGELGDALLLTIMDPCTASNYLRAAKVNSIQGKQQHAIDVLECGVKYCTDKCQVALLQDQISQATARLQRRIDFIARLPYDILCHIFAQFVSIDTSLTSIHVSTLWHAKLLSCPVPWRQFDLLETTPKKITRSQRLLIPRISTHIRRLKICFPASVLAEHIALIPANKFSNLRSLFIEVYASYRHNSDMTIPLYSALSSISGSLEELTLVNHISISVGKILNLCRNLTSLRCSADSITGVSDDYPIQHTTLLNKIRLRSDRDTMTEDEFVPIIQNSPNLRALQLWIFTGNILPIVAKYCPDLVALETNSADDSLEDDYFMRSDDIDSGSSKGLQVLSLTTIGSIQPISDLLEKSTDSLTSINLEDILRGVDDYSDWAPLTTHTFRKLTTINLILHHSPPSFRRQIAVIIRNCPALKCLRFREWYRDRREVWGSSHLPPSPVVCSIVEALTSLERLECLVLESFDIRPEIFNRFLEQNGDQLRELDLSYCHGATVATMRQLSKMTNLTQLDFSFPADATETDTTEFFKQVSLFPNLEELKVTGSTLSIEAAQYLANSKMWLTTFYMTMTAKVYHFLKDSKTIYFDPHPDEYDESE